MSFVALVVIIIAGYGWLRYRRNSKLVPYMLEYFLKITDPVSLCGKPDVVWITYDGTLVVGDYKSRDNHQQVFASEVIQLSVYKFLVEKTQQNPVANYGFIHFKNGKKMKVKLMSEKKVIELYYRYWNVVDGKCKPCINDGGHYCGYCSHQQKC